MKISHLLMIGGIILIIAGIVRKCTKETKKIEGDISYCYFSEWDGGRSYGYNYELKKQKDGKITLQYEKSFPEKEEQSVEITEEQLKEFTEKINNSEILSRDGFDKVDTNVLDGSSWTIHIVYENKEEIKAHGYESYPRRFSENTKIIISAFSAFLSDHSKETLEK